MVSAWHTSVPSRRCPRDHNLPVPKKGNVISSALVAHSFNDGILFVIDGRVLGGRIIEEDLAAVCASRLQSPDRKVRQQLENSPRMVVIVSGFLVCQQQAGILCAPYG